MLYIMSPKIWACVHQDGIPAVIRSLFQTEKLEVPVYGRKATDSADACCLWRHKAYASLSLEFE